MKEPVYGAARERRNVPERRALTALWGQGRREGAVGAGLGVTVEEIIWID
jgi:hypothetical protein